jgi:hypothetical protein
MVLEKLIKFLRLNDVLEGSEFVLSMYGRRRRR